ncbi:hypothetical protein [Chromatocurvus halotolerans]|uniref:Uncharacterized protein n=1 Tax=Chromatocurvus halotolerans TaxID=1132028 RepID=A0A4R2KIQ3_9GAMM|nr:hypothetical protein [Chromatocurvus halotolerans]TCO73761.1 hypothetical protein EV688_11578 [Chromatocurvus halotolerans]
MALLKHQLVLHPDIVSQFAVDKPIMPYERRFGFSWQLCPWTLADDQGWLLINVEFAYCNLVESGSAADIEESALDAIESHLPYDREEDNVSVSFNPDDITWHTLTKMPEHVAKRYQKALKLIRKCPDRFEAMDKIERLNNTPVTLGGRTFSPSEALDGLLLELADNFRDYIETTPWWKLHWHIWTKKDAPWLEQDSRGEGD